MAAILYNDVSLSEESIIISKTEEVNEEVFRFFF